MKKIVKPKEDSLFAFVHAIDYIDWISKVKVFIVLCALLSVNNGIGVPSSDHSQGNLDCIEKAVVIQKELDAFQELQAGRLIVPDEPDPDCCEQCYLFCEPTCLAWSPWMELCCRICSFGMAWNEPCGVCTVCNPKYRRRIIQKQTDKKIEEPVETLV